MDSNIFRVITDLELKLPLYVTSAGGWSNQEAMDRPDGFPDYQWIQTWSGTGQLELKDKTYTVGPGQGMLLYAKEAHRYHPVREPWTVRWVSFNGAQAASMLASFRFEASQVLYLTNPGSLWNKLHDIQTVLRAQDPLGSIECSSLTYQLLLDLFLYASTSEVRSKQQHFEQLGPVFTYIAENYDKTVTLEEMAQQLGVTPQHTCLLFQQTLGMRPFAYLTRYRLRKAKELLLQEQLEVREIAKRVGYEDTSYFIKLFKRQEGVTPIRFRKIHGLS
ncbi:AraC family transcriptional regulator [Paenibacillus sp. GD4]|uniref:AraC family transcriptional regulator n=1 Tax=Paenibacillus sp. GD4 TaxID=3068890 RepID=UPI0027966350|nr:AraC family transcriptional regulator [Paenibacillus sp. GD4]MDQ1910992.1 AraC family transcriptional regulator [Paenibacillus sp. GD4]